MKISVWLTRVVDTSTLKGLKQAERLQAKGYEVLKGGYKFTAVGIDKVMFWIPNPRALKVMSAEDKEKMGLL
jgi:hypothetical protein